MDRLEAENARLREALSKAEAMLVGNELWVKTRAENRALQDRIEEVAGYAVQLRPLSHEQALILPKLLQLLSPTQETDPE